MEQGDARFKTVLRLILSGFDIEPELISGIVGVPPSRTWRKGDPRYEKNPSILHTENGWIWTCSIDPLDAQVAEALARLREEVNPAKLHKLPEKTSILLSFAVYAFEEVPALYLSANDVSWISSLGAALDFDV